MSELYNVTVNANNVMLPNGRLYQNADTAVLTKEEFFKVDPAQVGAGPLWVTLDSTTPVPTTVIP